MYRSSYLKFFHLNQVDLPLQKWDVQAGSASEMQKDYSLSYSYTEAKRKHYFGNANDRARGQYIADISG
jgi:hypothetical protein